MFKRVLTASERRAVGRLVALHEAEYQRLLEEETPSHANVLLETAWRYAALTQGGVRNPVTVISAETGLSIHGTRARIGQARTAGYLTPATPGRVGGKLTERAKELLSD